MPRAAQFTREQILRAAFELVRQHGWSGFTVPAVAKAVGSSTMPIYSHFKSLEKLQDAVCVRAFDLLKERVRQPITGDLWIDVAVRYLEFAVEERQLFRCMWDGRNPDFLKRAAHEFWDGRARVFEGHPTFAGSSDEVRADILQARGLLTHGMACFLSVDEGLFRPSWRKKSMAQKVAHVRKLSAVVSAGVKSLSAPRPSRSTPRRRSPGNR